MGYHLLRQDLMTLWTWSLERPEWRTGFSQAQFGHLWLLGLDNKRGTMQSSCMACRHGDQQKTPGLRGVISS